MRNEPYPLVLVTQTHNMTTPELLFVRRKPADNMRLAPIPKRDPLSRRLSVSETNLATIHVPTPNLNHLKSDNSNETSFLGSRYDIGLSRRKLIASRHHLLDEAIVTKKEERMARSLRFHLWRSFHYVGRNTSFHGIPHLMAGRSLIRTFYWLLLILAAISLMIFAMVTISNEYFDRETFFSESVQFPNSIEFPAVTFCSHNPYIDKDYSQFPIEVQVAIRYENYRKDRLFESNTASILDALEEQFNISSQNFSENVTIETVLREHGHRFIPDHGFFHCRFDGRTCHPDNFTETVTAFGLCSTFNLVTNDDEMWNVSNAGRSHGLELILDIWQGDYLYFTSHTAGIQVFIHPKDEYPYSGEFHGFSVPPGFETQVAISLTNTKLMDPPYGQCGNRAIHDPYIFPCTAAQSSNSTMTNSTTDYSDHVMQSVMKCPQPIERYTRQRCLDECEALYQNRRCGCKADYLPGGDIRVCNLNELFNCLLNVTDQFAEVKNSVCDCPLECNQKRYDARISQSYFPALTYSRQLQLRYYGQVYSQTDVRADILSLVVYYDQLEFREVTEKAEYSTFQYVADLGGHLGLFTGAGLLSFFELFELCLSTFYPVYDDH